MDELTTLVLKLPRNTEVTPEAAKTFLASLSQINSVSLMNKLTGVHAQALALEIALVSQQIRFQITCDKDLVPFIETQIQSNYPLVIMNRDKDPLIPIFENNTLKVVCFKLRRGSYYPIATTDSFTDVDPLSSVLSVLSKGDPDQVALIQYALESVGTSWQSKGSSFAEKGVKNEDGTYSPRPDATIINEKISYPGFKVSIRIASNDSNTLKELSSSFGVFTRSEGNSFSVKKPSLVKKKPPITPLIKRRVTDNQILNIEELSTVWHLPSDKIKTASIAWGTSVLTEPPHNLPIAHNKTDEEKQEINFFAKTQFKNREVIFGIKDKDRRRHIWTVGKTGTGKSTMIANMAIDDFKKNRGVAVIDPHGDNCEILLNYIPKSRINDTVYFNPADKDHPIVLNPLEVTNREEAELVVSGLMAIFTKVWANVWSARMEYILRNSFMTLAEHPNTTLEDVLKLLANKNFRDRIVSNTKDSALVHFWREEYDKMPDRLQKEAIAPIQNKVGQFATSPLIRRIIGKPKSTISMDDVMNGSKILLANLSQGKLGEDNANLLGAMLITKIQLAAMRRVNIDEEERKDFFFYVDEFQNFATTSFIKILSEARKYRLNLTLANQYMAQIPEEVQKAILGNAGTMISFAIGAEDAAIINKEYAEVFSENDLVNLSNFQIALKLMIDGHSSRPFLANTLPLPASVNQNKEKVIKVSRERWAKSQEENIAKAEQQAQVPQHLKNPNQPKQYPPKQKQYHHKPKQYSKGPYKPKPKEDVIYVNPDKHKKQHQKYQK
ncbi:type IV secretory system conjugative DNA transfer family protein [Patescibacteria group bacterium]